MNVKQDPAQTSLKDCSIPNILENKVLKELSPNSHGNIEQDLRLSRSKLPRIVKTKTNTYPNKCKSFEKRQNESGDNKPCSSQSSRSPPNSEGEKLKPSQIPRRRVNSCDAPTKQSNSKRPFPKSTFRNDTKNVQRLHILNTFQDFCTDRPSASVGYSRPIPTLGRIYQSAGNRDTNWFIETDSSFMETLSVSIDADRSVSVNESTGDAVEGSLCTPDFDVMSKPLSLEQPTVFNERLSQNFGAAKENNCQWSDELEYPTRDSESREYDRRHGTTSPKVRSNDQLESPIVKESEKVYMTNVVPDQIGSAKLIPPSDTSKNNITGKKIKEQSTVILVERARPSAPAFVRRLRPDTSMTLTQTSESEFSKTFQFPSNPNKINGFAISYVDCASEVLQKTTDFETAVATDKESSRGTFDNNDMLEEDGSMWSYTRDGDSTNLFSSSEDYSKSDHTTIMKGKESGSSDTFLVSSGYNHRYSFFCIKNRNISRMHDVYSHRKCFFHRSKGRKEFKKFKERRSAIPRKRLSFRRMCRRHWNYVCQKTAERWASWPKSSVKFKKFRMLYLHPGIDWEDVDVQTVSAVCRDNATATIIKELRSNGIATSLRLSPLKTDTATSGKSLTLSMLKNFQPPIQQPSLAYAIPTLQENNSTLHHKCQSHHTETKCKEINLPIYRACDSFSSRFYSNIQTAKKADDVLVPKSVNDGTQSEADNTDSQDSQLFSVESKVTVLSCADSMKRATEDKSTHTIGSIKRSSIKSNKSVSRHASCISKTMFKSNDELAKLNKNSSVLNESVIKSSWAGSKNQQNSGKGSSACGIVESKDGTEFSFKPNSESTNPAAYLSSLYLQPQPPNQTFPKMMSFSAEANAPNLTKVCQTGPSSSWVHFLCHRSTSMGQNMYSPSRHSTCVTTSCLATKKSVETETENVSKSSSETLDRISAGFATTASIFPVKITKGTSGSRMDTILKKDASIETIPPTVYLGFKGPKIISISSGLLPTISSTSASIKCKTQSIGITTNEVKLHEKEVLPPSQKRSRAWNLICCGTDTTSDVEWCSRSTIVEASDLETDSEMKKKTSKSSFIGGSFEVPTVNVLTTKYVPACINTESMQKCVGVGPSTTVLETPLKLDFCAQPGPYKEDIVRSNRSTGFSCNMEPGVFIVEISTQTDKPPVISGHDQETLTAQEPLWSATSECGTEPDAARCSPDAEELIKNSIYTTDRDQNISTEKPENDYDQNGNDYVTAPANPTPRVSESRPPSPKPSGARPPSLKPSAARPPSLKPSAARPPSPKPSAARPPSPQPSGPSSPTPRPLAEAGPVCASLGVTCVACFKPKVSSPFLPLSKNVSKEKVHKMLSTEKEITNVAMTQSGSAGDMSMARPQGESNDHVNSSDISRAPSPPGLQEEATGDLGFTCITCLKTQKSSPLLSPFKNVSNENTNKLSTTEKNVISTVMRHGTGTIRSNKSLKGTVAQTAIEVQDAATDPCSCEKKSENVFTSRFLLAAPQPCRHGACHQSTECLYVYEQPQCVVHRKLKDVIVQMQPSQRDVVLAAMSVPQSACSVPTPEEPVLQRSGSQITDFIGLINDNLDVTPLMVKDKATNTDESYHFLPTIAFTAPQSSLHSFGVLTSNSVEDELCVCDRAGVLQSDPERGHKQHEEIVEVYTQTSRFDEPLHNVPRAEDGSTHPLEGYLTSCRYYGSLLTSKLNRVKENLTKRLTPSDETIYEAYDTQEGCVLNNTEACTMKPSGRNEFCGQADFPKRKIVKTVSCFVLGHAYSVTDFGRGHEEDNLNAVYCMLSAIEGRIRRMKRNTFTYR